jgi:hypothetical protein
VTPPTGLPVTVAGLTDWAVFQSEIASRIERAHRFRVLVPARANDPSPYRDVRRLDQVRRVVELEKPAHTAFDIRYFWDAFRVGEVVLGQPTPIDLGGRLSWPPLIAGYGYLSEGVLASTNPGLADERRVLGPARASAPGGRSAAGDRHVRLCL